MSKTQIRTTIDGPTATLTLITDGGLNVMSSRLLLDLRRELADLAKNESVRATVLHGDGKVFAAGADIKEMAAFKPHQARRYGELGQAVLGELDALPSITIAALNGAALGGGMELALACDFRVAVKSAKVGLPEASLGLIPGWGGIGRLTRLIGPSRAKKLYLSALPVSAEIAADWGFVDELVNSPEDLMPRVLAFAKSLRRASPQAVALAKRAARTGDDLTAFADCFDTADAKEGIAAFVEKRPASWME